MEITHKDQDDAEQKREIARKRLIEAADEPENPAYLELSAAEIMEIMEIDEYEARQLFPDKFPNR